MLSSPGLGARLWQEALSCDDTEGDHREAPGPRASCCLLALSPPWVDSPEPSLSEDREARGWP